MQLWQSDHDSSMTTKELLSEPMASARIREDTAFTDLAMQADEGIVLFGAGRLGQKVASALGVHGVKPLAFVDNDARIQGTKVEGVPVLLPAAAAKRWRDNALFVVTTFLPAGGGVQARLDELASLGCRRITSFLSLGWKYKGVLPHFGADLPSRLLEHSKELEEVGALWCDDSSRETFRQALVWRLRADFEEANTPAPDQYFPRDIILPNPDESFIDGGAFDGDTLRVAPWRLAKVLAIEPDPASAAKLRSWGGAQVQLHEVVLGRAGGSTRFEGSGTMASSRSGVGTLERAVATLDELAASERPTFLKLDVEGDELAALQGGIGMLRRAGPVVAACVYHRPEDLWTIPLFLHEALPAHQMYLRSHAWDGFELVTYAVPPQRCLQRR